MKAKMCEMCLNAVSIAEAIGVSLPTPELATAAQLMHNGVTSQVRMLCDAHHSQALTDGVECWGHRLEDPWLAWPRQVH